MKQSIFKKELSAIGKNGTFTGSVVATLNYTTKTITGTHAGTHDDYTKMIPVHKVEAFINGKYWSGNPEMYHEELVFSVSQQVMKSLQIELNKLANENPEPTFIEKMTKLFE
jgi:hypothetical protein